jgi:hypothetical protein
VMRTRKSSEVVAKIERDPVRSSLSHRSFLISRRLHDDDDSLYLNAYPLPPTASSRLRCPCLLIPRTTVKETDEHAADLEPNRQPAFLLPSCRILNIHAVRVVGERASVPGRDAAAG